MDEVKRTASLKNTLPITSAQIDDETGSLTILIDGQEFWAGEKYTVLETGWAVYAANAELPDGWLERWGETRQGTDDTGELKSFDKMLVTSHPVLVALNLMAWWHRNGLALDTKNPLRIPRMNEAIEYVRDRRILNDFNQRHSGKVPGVFRWSE